MPPAVLVAAVQQHLVAAPHVLAWTHCPQLCWLWALLWHNFTLAAPTRHPPSTTSKWRPQKYKDCSWAHLPQVPDSQCRCTWRLLQQIQRDHLLYPVAASAGLYLERPAGDWNQKKHGHQMCDRFANRVDRMQRWRILPEANQLQLLPQALPPQAIYPVAAPLLQQTADYFQVINSV